MRKADVDEEKSGAPTPPLRGRRPRVAALLVGAVALAGLIAVITHVGDIGAFAQKVRDADPRWFGYALLAQVFAFVSQAFAWRIVLQRRRARVRGASLVSLTIGKLFVDQAIPSAGLSGAVFLVHALTRRRISQDDAFAVFIFGAASSILAFILFAAGSLLFLSLAGGRAEGVTIDANELHFLAIGALLLLAVIAVIQIATSEKSPVRWQAAADLAAKVKNAAGLIGKEKALFAGCLLFQSGARLFDIVTLYFVFFALGAPAPFATAAVGVSLGALASTLAPTPMGLGSFEAGLVGALAALGIGVEDGLAATLVYRGLSLWLPLALGFFIVQRELLKK